MEHFRALSFSRSYNANGPNPIDIKSILRYNNEITKMRAIDFIYLIQSLDSMYLEHVNAKKARAKEKGR